jgi:hypothetical protein
MSTPQEAVRAVLTHEHEPDAKYAVVRAFRLLTDHGFDRRSAVLILMPYVQAADERWPANASEHIEYVNLRRLCSLAARGELW